MENYKMLGEAIVVQAAEDYREAYREYLKALSTIEECEDFFKSDWYAMMTNLDPDLLIKKLKEEVESENIEDLDGMKIKEQRIFKTKRRLREKTNKVRKNLLKAISGLDELDEIQKSI